MWRWLRLLGRRGRVARVHGDAQLRLYNRILPGDFLHYGYFDDPDTPAGSIGFDDVRRAQLRYAEELIALIEDRDGPVLDAGCGMGGMLGLLKSRGFDVAGLTPDRFQARHIREAYPDVPVIEDRFEALDGPAGTDDPANPPPLRRRFRTVVHSESIQYMDPDRVFEVMDGILAPDGAWIVADYFRVGAGGERSGWPLDDFRRRIAASGFRVAGERDVTAHVLPTLAFAHLLATRLGLPALEFAQDKARTKVPALHYILEEALTGARDGAVKAAAVVDPAVFAATKRYIIVKLKPGSSNVA